MAQGLWRPLLFNWEVATCPAQPSGANGLQQDCGPVKAAQGRPHNPSTLGGRVWGLGGRWGPSKFKSNVGSLET